MLDPRVDLVGTSLRGISLSRRRLLDLEMSFDFGHIRASLILRTLENTVGLPDLERISPSLISWSWECVPTFRKEILIAGTVFRSRRTYNVRDRRGGARKVGSWSRLYKSRDFVSPRGFKTVLFKAISLMVSLMSRERTYRPFRGGER